MPRTNGPQAATSNSSDAGPTKQTRQKHSQYGLPWTDTCAVSIRSDGSVAVNRNVDATHRVVVVACGTPRKVVIEDDRSDSADRFGFGRISEAVAFDALMARDAVLGHECSCLTIDGFIGRSLVLPRGPQWNQAVSTALLGDWVAPLHDNGRIDGTVLGRIKSEAEAVHRQLVPLWRRRVRGSRVLLLETPLGDNLTLHDLIAGKLRMDDLVFEAAFGDARINAVLAGLHPAEQRVAMAWAHPAIATWTEAARFAGAASPEAFGERVRRKLKRLGEQHTTRAAAAAATVSTR